MTDFPSQQSEKKTRRPARVEQLAKLPVFWDLNGKHVLIAGASDAVAWKAELLAACGAEVHICLGQENPSHGLSMIDKDNQKVVLFSHSWVAADLSRFALALADCEDEREARAFYEGARAAGVPVNVIDKPEFCQFQFGSIVNRSPVVIAISTDGAAPILAQAIRRRIETLLPPALKGWAMLARKLRSDVTEQLGAGVPRRAFWERFVDMAFKGNAYPGESEERKLKESIGRISALGDKLAGGLTYVGAGPGEAEMLTLQAVRALQSADIILYEDGITAEVLELARREAKRMFVNDCGEGPHAARNQVLQLLRTGKRVVRLVAGDARLTPEATEESAFFARFGFETTIVRGITAEVQAHQPAGQKPGLRSPQTTAPLQSGQAG